MVEGNELKKLVDDFIQEYIDLSHMEEVPPSQQRDESGKVSYIPYLSVIRKEAITTKLRVVFNASSPTSNGVALNDIMYPGPKLQNSIFDILCRQRQFKWVYFSDIAKMYRQILLRPEDRDMFRIVYRKNKNSPFKEYRMTTVTYGVGAAPWQALRTLIQVADGNAPDESMKEIIKTSMYIDDLAFGGDSVEECQQQIKRIDETIASGQMQLTKWASNEQRVLDFVPQSRRLEDYVGPTESIKTLGVNYLPASDSFCFKIQCKTDIKYSKRGMLSVTASLFDPLGWILPVVMMLRILVQSLWCLELGWDDDLPQAVRAKFENASPPSHCSIKSGFHAGQVARNTIGWSSSDSATPVKTLLQQRSTAEWPTVVDSKSRKLHQEEELRR